ncbi:hypothetical protein B0H10DRAFT_1955821 [Mycena sp. CBHHK59/15]|nr:hypothetical protein B0H10DRAFT_1955821 [Mycena sp. CBHHK59/15]
MAAIFFCGSRQRGVGGFLIIGRWGSWRGHRRQGKKEGDGSGAMTRLDGESWHGMPKMCINADLVPSLVPCSFPRTEAISHLRGRHCFREKEAKDGRDLEHHQDPVPAEAGLVEKGVLGTEKRNFLLFDLLTHPVLTGWLWGELGGGGLQKRGPVRGLRGYIES